MTRYRPLVLTLIGLVWMAQAAAVSHRVYDPDTAILYEALPPHVRVTLWLLTGMGIIAGAWAPPRWTWAAVATTVVAVIMPAEQAVGHAWAYLMHLIPGVPGGDARSLPVTITWAAVAGIVVLVSRWPEPTTGGSTRA